MEATKSVYRSSDAVKDLLCEPCSKINNTNVAEWFCVDCSEYLCGHCYSYHKRYKQFENHALLDENRMPLDKKQVKPKDVCITKCSFHTDRVIEYVCKSCDKIGCSVCITKSHRACKHVEYIPDEVKKSDTIREFKAFAGKLDSTGKDLQELHKNIDRNFEVTDYDLRKALTDLDQQKNQIFTSLESLFDKMKNNINKSKKEENIKFNACLEEITSLEASLNQTEDRMNTLEKGGQSCELFIFMTEKKSTLEKISAEMSTLSEKGKETRIRYEPSREVEEIIRDEITETGRLVFGDANQNSQSKYMYLYNYHMIKT